MDTSDSDPGRKINTPFTPVIEAIARDPDLGVYGALIFGAVYRFWREYGACTASTDQIAERAFTTKRNVIKYLEILRSSEKGLLHDHTPDFKNRPHTYTPTRTALDLLAGEGHPDTPTVHEIHRHGELDAPHGVPDTPHDESSSPHDAPDTPQGESHTPPTVHQIHRHGESDSLEKSLKTPNQTPEEPPPPRAQDPADDDPDPVIQAIRTEHQRSPLDGGYAWGGVWVQVHERGVQERIGGVLDKIRPEWVPRAFQLTDEKASDPCLNYALSILARWARQGGPGDELAERISDNGKPKRQTSDRRGDGPGDDYPTLDPARFEPGRAP